MKILSFIFTDAFDLVKYHYTENKPYQWLFQTHLVAAQWLDSFVISHGGKILIEMIFKWQKFLIQKQRI